MIIPEHLRVEEKRLVEEYMQSTETCGMLEYAMKHGSDELNAFYDAFDEEEKWAKEHGMIID